MNERLKRVLFIGGFLCVTVGIAFLIYRVFFKNAEPVNQPTSAYPRYQGQLSPSATGTQTGTTTTAPGGLNPAQGTTNNNPAGQAAAPSRTTVLNTNVNQFISLSSDGSGVRSYNPVDGKFYKISNDGTSVPLSSQAFFNVQDVNWGNKSDKAIMTYPDGSKIYYDFTNNTQASLPKTWEDFNFAPQDNQIVAKSVGNNESNRFLVISNPDGSNAQLVADMGENQDKVHSSWSPNDQIVAYSFTGDPIGFDRQSIVMVGKHQENFKNLIVEGRGFVPNWSPSGNNILYSVYSSADDYKPTLWVSGAVGDSMNANRQNIKLNTWADKCAWQNEQSIVCAVPTSLGTGAGLQRDLFANVPDSIYRIDLQNGSVVNLGQPDGNPSINKVVLSPDGTKLYYDNHSNGTLASFSLR